MLDKRTRGKVLGLRVRCRKDGCDWKGELGDLERHVSDKCLYVKEVCPHGCGQSFPRWLLQSHKLDECPQRPFQLQLETVQKQLHRKLEQQERKNKDKIKTLIVSILILFMVATCVQSWMIMGMNKQKIEIEKLQQQLKGKAALQLQFTIYIMLYHSCNSTSTIMVETYY